MAALGWTVGKKWRVTRNEPARCREKKQQEWKSVKQEDRTPGTALGFCSPVSMWGPFMSLLLNHPRFSIKAVREVVTGRGQKLVIQSGLGLLDSREWKQLRIDIPGDL